MPRGSAETTQMQRMARVCLPRRRCGDVAADTGEIGAEHAKGNALEPQSMQRGQKRRMRVGVNHDIVIEQKFYLCQAFCV